MYRSDSVWTPTELADPHAVADKARRVRAMFAAIAPKYDLNNRLHSMGRDQAWRRAAVKLADVRPGDTVLDVACGTGDLALAFSRAGVARVLGVDFTYDMLAIAKNKPPAAGNTVPGYQAGDAMRLPIADQSVDVVSIAFGIRNVVNPALAIGEFSRVLRPGGRLVILEFSQPNNTGFRRIYHFYFKYLMPRTAALVARDRSGAYKYLPQSVSKFIDRDEMVAILGDAGFIDATMRPLTMGIAVLYRGIKPVSVRNT